MTILGSDDSPIALAQIRPDRSGIAVLKEPHTCPRCKTEHMFVVNRNGETWCIECDETRIPKGIKAA